MTVDGKDSRKRADLERINSAGKHLLSLVTDVLDLSKIESNHIDLKIEKFDLSEMVREVVATVEPMVVENKNKLIVKCPQGLGIVSTDQTKLRQAALNLLSNAAKFTRDGTVTFARPAQEKPGGRLDRDPGAGHRHRHRGSGLSAGCSRTSARRTVRPPANTAAPALAWRSVRSCVR